MTSSLVFFCAAIVMASLLGGALPLATILTHTRLQLYLSFAAGTMLGAVFFHMLPEAVEIGPDHAMKWVAMGLLAVFFLERFFSFHHHEAPADPADPCPEHAHSHHHGPGHAAGLVVVDAPGGSGPETKGTNLLWGVAAVGLTLHTLAGGFALASASAVETEGTPVSSIAWSVFLATLVHKPADALTIVSLMVRAGVPRGFAHLVNFGFSLMIPAGVGLFYLGLQLLDPSRTSAFVASALGFSAGTFLCIALSDLLPELQFHSHDRIKLSLALLGGFGLMAATTLWE